MRLRIRLLLLAIAVPLLNGCGGDSCTGINPGTYTVASINAAVLAYETELTTPEHSHYSLDFESPVLPEDPLTYNRLILEVAAAHDIVQRTPTQAPFRLQWSLFHPAVACSPLMIEPQLTSLTITSTRDFSLEYPAGTDLSPLFYVTYTSEPLLIAYEQDGRLLSYTAEEFSSMQPYVPGVLLLRLGRAPDSEQTHVFTVEYKFEGGRAGTVQAQTQAVRIAL